jgi:hypothetical protein
VPDQTDANPGTTDGPETAPHEADDERNEAGQREQGVRTEESRDLSSPRFTVHDNDHEAS